MSSLRVVWLISHLGLGGSERQLFLLLSHLNPAHIESHVIVFNPSPNYVFDAALARQNVRVWTIPPSAPGIVGRTSTLWRRLRRIEPDVIHSWSFYANAYAGVVGRLAEVPYRFGSLRNDLSLSPLPAPLRWLALRSVSPLFVNAHSIAGDAEAAGVPRDHVTYLPNSVDLRQFDPQSTSPADLSALGIGSDRRVIGMVANLRAVKNHRLFIDVVARLVPQFDDLTGLIVGQPLTSEPDYPARLRAHIAALNLSNRVVLAGFRRDIPALLRRMDIVCLTSHSEGMPNVLLEALAMERPVVATRVGGAVELLESGCGLLVPPGDAATMANAVAMLLRQPDQRQAYGQAGRAAIARQHTPLRTAQHLMQAYRSALPERLAP